MNLSYIKLFVYMMPWPALFLIVLMMIPFPRIIKKPILWLADKILFFKV